MAVSETPDDETRDGVLCAVCGQPFTAEEWDLRHSPKDAPLEDVHEVCCPDCDLLWPEALADDLQVIRDAGLRTTNYSTYQPEHGVALRTSLGHPRFWKGGRELVNVPSIAPPSRSIDRFGYEATVHAREETIVRSLAAVAREHPGQPLVVLCFEDVLSGQECHRRWFASWFERRFGIDAVEVDTRPLTLFDEDA